MKRKYKVCPVGDKDKVSEVLVVDQFPWFKGGKKQLTYVNMTYNDHVINLYVHCEDDYPTGTLRNYGDSVYLDSCFEWFFSPGRNNCYINLEVNCLGTKYIAYGDEDMMNRQLIKKELSDTISVKTTYKESNQSQGDWDLLITVPFSTIEKITGEKVVKEVWTSNFYRCGGQVDPQYACWNKIVYPVPTYHITKYFGEIHFQ